MAKLKNTVLNVNLSAEEAQALLMAANYSFKDMPYNMLVMDVFGGDQAKAMLAFVAKRKVWFAMEEAENREIDMETKRS